MAMLLLCSFMPVSAQAQRACDEAIQHIYRIAETPARQIPDSLQTLLDLATFFRDCEDDVSVELDLWLLNNEVFALDKLGRYEEASTKVAFFFDTRFDEASNLYRARFYLWRLRFDAFSGDAVGMIVAYNEAKQYTEALDVPGQAHLHLDGAYAYREINEFEIALTLIDKAETLIGEPTTMKDSLALARIWRASAETLLRLGTRLQQVRESLRDAVRLYETLGDTVHVVTARTLLGEAYAALGDTTAALAEIEAAAATGRNEKAVRYEIAALYRRGHLLRKRRDYGASEQALLQALNASERVREFHLRVLYELARLYEEQHDYARATSYYQAIIDAPEPGSLIAELEAARQAREGRIRILLIKQDRNRTLLLFALAGIVLLLGLVGTGFYFHLRRRAIYEQIQESIVPPEHLKTGLSLPALHQRFQKITGSELLGKRLAHIYAVLFDPQLVLDYIDDPYLKPQVESGSVENNTALFECAAMVEEAVDEQRTFRGNAANTIRSYLLTEFRKREWKWPKSPLAWKRYFLAHHVKRLV